MESELILRGYKTRRRMPQSVKTDLEARESEAIPDAWLGVVVGLLASPAVIGRPLCEP